MHGHRERRRDYTPLFKFLLSQESSYYSGMHVDAEGLLQIVDPSMSPSSLVPQCKCCTHTFNGIPFTRPFAGLRGTVEPGGDGA
ncbi:hypothetical protein J7E70_07700 [Variovorax paradoxus]|nr:hypothetical protein [Variovorax paradoxus]